MIFHEAVALVAIFIFVQHRIVTMSVYLDCNHYKSLLCADILSVLDDLFY